MKIAIQYLNDLNGDVQAVQLPLNDWQKLLGKLKRYEQALRLKTDLKEAYDEVSELRKSKTKKQTLNEFLDEL